LVRILKHLPLCNFLSGSLATATTSTTASARTTIVFKRESVFRDNHRFTYTFCKIFTDFVYESLQFSFLQFELSHSRIHLHLSLGAANLVHNLMIIWMIMAKSLYILIIIFHI